MKTGNERFANGSAESGANGFRIWSKTSVLLQRALLPLE
jgi:hypothetical protein